MITRDVKQAFVRVQKRKDGEWATEGFVRKVYEGSESGYVLQDYNGHRTSFGCYRSSDGEHTLDVGVFGRIHPDDLAELNALFATRWTPDPPWPETTP